MKICIFTETYFPVVGGGETQARLLAEGLTAAGHSVLIVTRRSDASLPVFEKYGDIRVYRLGPVGSGRRKKWGLIVSAFPTLLALRDEYDLIFVAGYRLIGITAVLAGKLLGRKVILKADSQGEMSGEYFTSGLAKLGAANTSLFFKIFLTFRNGILKQADAFAAMSTEIRSEWIASRIPPNKIHLIPNGVDTETFIPPDAKSKRSLREKLSLPQDRFIAVYTGRLVSYKGLPLLLRAWNEIGSKYQNALLLLVGPGGLDIHNCERELRDFVTAHQLEHSVCFTGAVQNVAEYLQASDVFVFPTENEAFGAAVLEAMACALPVISTPVGALKHIITHDQNGFLIQPGNPQQLFVALDRIISDTALALRLGQAARETAVEHYSVRQVTGKYISLFQKILSYA